MKKRIENKNRKNNNNNNNSFLNIVNNDSTII